VQSLVFYYIKDMDTVTNNNGAENIIIWIMSNLSTIKLSITWFILFEKILNFS